MSIFLIFWGNSQIDSKADDKAQSHRQVGTASESAKARTFGEDSPAHEPGASDLARRLEPNAEIIPGYLLTRRLGKGGFGEVWRANGPGGVPVALKILHVAEPLTEVEAQSLQFMKFICHP